MIGNDWPFNKRKMYQSFQQMAKKLHVYTEVTNPFSGRGNNPKREQCDIVIEQWILFAGTCWGDILTVKGTTNTNMTIVFFPYSAFPFQTIF